MTVATCYRQMKNLAPPIFRTTAKVSEKVGVALECQAVFRTGKLPLTLKWRARNVTIENKPLMRVCSVDGQYDHWRWLSMPQASSYNVTDIFIEAGLKTADKILTIAQKGCASLSNTLDLIQSYGWLQQARLNRNKSMETLT